MQQPGTSRGSPETESRLGHLRTATSTAHPRMRGGAEVQLHVTSDHRPSVQCSESQERISGMTRWGGDRLGGQLTTDNLLQALAALGTPAVLVADEPTRADFLELLGCLLASTEAALTGMDPAELTAVRDGYRSQIGNSDDGVLRLLTARLDVLVLQLNAHPTAPAGTWLPVTADGIEHRPIAATPVTRYRWRGTTIPSPWPATDNA